MKPLDPRSARRGLLLALILIAFVTAGEATITDDINPQRNLVHVKLVNDDPKPDKGLVEVVVDLGDGKISSSVEPYSVDAKGTTGVTATFESKVIDVIEVRIIEGPDPI